MRELELEVERQLLFPGEKIRGSVSIDGPGDKMVSVTLQGEEVHRYNLGPDVIVPFLEESKEIDCTDGPAYFEFVVPENSKPSYTSKDLRCGYILKARRAKALPGFLPGMRRDAIHRLNLTVAADQVEVDDRQHWFALEHGPVRLEVRLDQLAVYAGESVTGEFALSTREPDALLPKEITIHFAAIEESLDGGKSYRRVIWKEVERIVPPLEDGYPLKALFEFSVPLDSPDSGRWHIFQLFYGFRVGMTLANGKHLRESLNIEVRRDYKRIQPASFAEKLHDRLETDAQPQDTV